MKYICTKNGSKINDLSVQLFLQFLFFFNFVFMATGAIYSIFVVKTLFNIGTNLGFIYKNRKQNTFIVFWGFRGKFIM